VSIIITTVVVVVVVFVVCLFGWLVGWLVGAIVWGNISKRNPLDTHTPTQQKGKKLQFEEGNWKRLVEEEVSLFFPSETGEESGALILFLYAFVAAAIFI